MGNNAIIVKIVESEVDFGVLQSNECTNPATQLILKTAVLGLRSVKISAQSVRYLVLHLMTTTTTTVVGCVLVMATVYMYFDVCCYLAI